MLNFTTITTIEQNIFIPSRNHITQNTHNRFHNVITDGFLNILDIKFDFKKNQLKIILDDRFADNIEICGVMFNNDITFNNSNTVTKIFNRAPTTFYINNQFALLKNVKSITLNFPITNFRPLNNVNIKSIEELYEIFKYLMSTNFKLDFIYRNIKHNIKILFKMDSFIINKYNKYYIAYLIIQNIMCKYYNTNFGNFVDYQLNFLKLL